MCHIVPERDTHFVISKIDDSNSRGQINFYSIRIKFKRKFYLKNLRCSYKDKIHFEDA